MPFKVSSILNRSSDGHNITVAEAFDYVAENGEVITVPAGTVSDGASVPKMFWNLIPPFGKHWMPAVMHDYLYRCTQTPKARCDDLFHEAMISTGTDPAVAKIIYDAVHLGGGIAFTEDRLAELKHG